MAARNEMAPARNEMMSSPRNDMSANGKRTQRAPGPAPRYAKFTLDDASAGYLNLPHGFQNPIKPSGKFHGGLLVRVGTLSPFKFAYSVPVPYLLMIIRDRYLIAIF